MEIGGINPGSFLDYPMLYSYTIFTQGCNMKCSYCHNPEFIEKKPGAYTWEQVRADIFKRRKFLDAVVFSGGEPTLQEDLYNKIAELKLTTGLKIGLHTNGQGPLFEVVAPLCDYILLSHTTKLTQKIASACDFVEYSKVRDGVNYVTEDWSN